MNGDIRADVRSTLQSLRGLEPLKVLFWQQLSYDRVNQPLSRDDWPKAANRALSEDPVLFAQAGDFCIFYCRLASDRLRLTDERAVVNRLLREYPYALFVFSNSNQDRWHFVNVKERAGPTPRWPRDEPFAASCAASPSARRRAKLYPASDALNTVPITL